MTGDVTSATKILVAPLGIVNPLFDAVFVWAQVGQAYPTFSPEHVRKNARENIESAGWINKVDGIVANVGVEIYVSPGKSDRILLRKPPDLGIVVSCPVVIELLCYRNAARKAKRKDSTHGSSLPERLKERLALGNPQVANNLRSAVDIQRPWLVWRRWIGES